MTTEALEIQARPQSAIDIRAQVNLIQEVMRTVMKPEVHFGKIPGCDKPSLWKPGAEKLLSTFHIAIEPIVEDLSTEDVARYRVITRATTANDHYLGSGVGEASSEEEKYKWRSVVCQEEWDATPENRRRLKWKKAQKPYSVQQVRTEKADIANTILKMAKKRSMIDVTLTVTGASDCFSQDIEDLPEEYRTAMADEHVVTNGEAVNALPATLQRKSTAVAQPQIIPPQPQTIRPPAPVVSAPRPPQPAPQTAAPRPTAPQPTGSPTSGPVISEPQRRRFFAIWKGAGRNPQEVKDYLLSEIGSADDAQIPRSKYEAICDWAEGR